MFVYEQTMDTIEQSAGEIKWLLRFNSYFTQFS